MSVYSKWQLQGNHWWNVSIKGHSQTQSVGVSSSVKKIEKWNTWKASMSLSSTWSGGHGRAGHAGHAGHAGDFKSTFSCETYRRETTTQVPLRLQPKRLILEPSKLACRQTQTCRRAANNPLPARQAFRARRWRGVHVSGSDHERATCTSFTAV